MARAELTSIEAWALQLVRRTRRHLRRAPEPREVCQHNGLKFPKEHVKLKAAVRRLMNKGHLAQWKRPRQALRLRDPA